MLPSMHLEMCLTALTAGIKLSQKDAQSRNEWRRRIKGATG